MSKYSDPAVAIETSSGATVERLLEAGYAVYPVNPKAAKRYRERKAPSGTKTDHLDAWSMADALRLDGHTWRQLKPNDPLTTELRLLCRDEVTLIEQRTAFVCQLRAALHEYYPAALEAFEDWTFRSAWAFVEAFPTPEALAKAGKRKWEKFLHTHKLYSPATYQKRLDLFAQAEAFCGSQATTNAKSMLAVALASQLRALQSHLDKFRNQIEKLFARHPNHSLFGSLPGAGGKLAPRLLAELGDTHSKKQGVRPDRTYVKKVHVLLVTPVLLSIGVSHAPAAILGVALSTRMYLKATQRTALSEQVSIRWSMQERYGRRSLPVKRRR